MWRRFATPVVKFCSTGSQRGNTNPEFHIKNSYVIKAEFTIFLPIDNCLMRGIKILTLTFFFIVDAAVVVLSSAVYLSQLCLVLSLILNL